MAPFELKSGSPEETMAFSRKLAGLLRAGDVIALEGDLGAGKTHFVKGFVKALGCNDLVTSPTFTIMNEYECDGLNIYHFDMYRLSSAEDAYNLGFEEYFDLKSLNGFSLVEWAKNVEGFFPNNVLKIEILKTEKENQRRIL